MEEKLLSDVMENGFEKDVPIENQLSKEQMAAFINTVFRPGDYINGMYTIRDKLKITYSDLWRVNQKDKEYLAHFMEWDTAEIFDIYKRYFSDDELALIKEYKFIREVLLYMPFTLEAEHIYQKNVKSYFKEDNTYSSRSQMISDFFKCWYNLDNSLQNILENDLKRFIVWMEYDNKHVVILQVFDEPFPLEVSPFYSYYKRYSYIKDNFPEIIDIVGDVHIGERNFWK